MNPELISITILQKICTEYRLKFKSPKDFDDAAWEIQDALTQYAKGMVPERRPGDDAYNAAIDDMEKEIKENS